MSLIKKIRVQGWLDILNFFSLSSGIGQVRLGSCSLSWTVNEREESLFFWKGWLVGVFYGADQSHQRGIPIDRHFVG